MMPPMTVNVRVTYIIIRLFFMQLILSTWMQFVTWSKNLPMLCLSYDQAEILKELSTIFQYNK